MKKIRFVLLFLALFCMIFTAADIVAMTKPISAARDYNGTFDGAFFTGTVQYGTLYRDNEDHGTISGCNGEGCGKHPGVDISATSGTNVISALSGTVYRSDDNCSSTGWGGLIIIQSISPYTGETIYVSYAHLKQRNYSVNDWVNESSVIGLSGGGSGDYCHGNSTGAHLHFQIDKDDGSTHPWFPSTTTDLNTADTAFVVNTHTYNPMLFVTGKYNWTFNYSGKAEYWITNEVYWGVALNVLWIQGTTGPYVKRETNVSCAGFSKPCSGQIAVEASQYKYVTIGLQNNCVSNPVKIYFKTSLSDVWDETKVVSFDYTAPATYYVYMGNNSSWDGIIKNIRIDPAVTCNPSNTNNFSEIIISQ